MKCMIWIPCHMFDISKQNSSDNLQTNSFKICKNIILVRETFWDEMFFRHSGSEAWPKMSAPHGIWIAHRYVWEWSPCFVFLCVFWGGWTSFNANKGFAGKHRPRIAEVMARGQGLLEATCHTPWTLSWGLVSVCGPRPHCCPVILDVLALRA